MSQSPYANLGGELMEPVAQRTSVLAIISLVLAIVSVVPLLCLFPGSGALAVMFGGAALLLINRERGRLSGTGLAATGIVIGLLVTVLQIVVVMMVSRGMQFVRKNIVGPIDQGMVALDRGDLAGARKMFTPAADAQITDEMLKAFTASYQSNVGAYKGLPDSLLAVFQTYGKIGPGLNGMQGRNDTIPIPANFAKGEAALLVMIDQKAAQSGQAGTGVNAALPVLNLGVVTPSGKAAWIIDPATIPSATGIQIGPRGVRALPGARGPNDASKPGDELETSPLPAAPAQPESPGTPR